MTAELDRRPAGVLSRQLDRYGMTAAQLRTRSWTQLSRGVHLRRPVFMTPTQQLQWLIQVLPRSTVLGHLTAAMLRDWWLPNRLPSHVVFATTSSRVHVQRRGVYVRRSNSLELETIAGLPVASAEQTLVELARDLSLVDLVPMVDRAVALGADVDRTLRLARRQRGAQRLRHAVALADPRSESWWESVMRLLHVCSGLGPVESQVEITDGGVLVARADLHLVGTARFPECDGGEHRDKSRHGADLRREKAMRRLGADRFGYTTWEIEHQPDMIVRDGETARGWPADARRVADWRRISRDSTVTPHGRARLAARLARYRAAANG